MTIDHTATIGEAVCPYCGVGCRLWVEAAYGQVLRVKGCADAAANRGGICAKGATLPQVLHTPDRLTQPQLRSPRDGSLRPATWDQALGFAAERLRQIIARHGPDSVAFYGSGQLDTETVYLVGKLFKGHLGTNNTDSNSRLCMAAAVAGYRTSLGSDGPPTCYDDIDHADVILVIGSNMAEAHPVTFDRIRERRRASGGSPFLIVVDPRRTPTADAADLHLSIIPGSDIALLNLIGRRLLLANDARPPHQPEARARRESEISSLTLRVGVDDEFIREHTSGFEEYGRFLRELDEGDLLAACGVESERVDEVVARIGAASAWLSFYCMGLGQSTVGMWKHNSLINLHLLTGQIGKPGAGPFSLTGQPNAMGGREAGLLAHQLPGYRQVDSPDDRRVVEEHWRLPAGSISSRPGLTAVEMFRALETGKLKAIWIAGTNPLVSLPDLHQTRRAIERAELVIVQDAYHPTETTRFAHVLLPAATWAEKEWTSTNSERTVALSEKLIDPPGNARPDWEIVASLAKKLGMPGFDYQQRDQVWNEFVALTAGQPCDMTGVTAERLRRAKGMQWPCPSVDHPGTKRRYEDRRFATPDGRARFLPRPHRPPRETPDHEFPFVLTTGRLYSHWHTLTRTGKSAKLMAREPSPFVEIHPDDAARLGIGDGSLAQLSSRRGSIRLPARVSTSPRPGVVFVPFHWGDLWGDETAANYLTISAIGRVSKQPELKFCAVSVEPAPLAGSECVLPENAAGNQSVVHDQSNWLNWFSRG